jgi:hypothetical protein
MRGILFLKMQMQGKKRTFLANGKQVAEAEKLQAVCKDVSRILESDACSQNKVFRAAANIGYRNPRHTVV